MEIVQQLKRIQNVSYSCNEEITALNFSQNLVMDSLIVRSTYVSLISCTKKSGNIASIAILFLHLSRIRISYVFQLETREEII